MNEYIECQGCGFVLQTGDRPAKQPIQWDACPECDGSTFEAPTNDSIGLIEPGVVDSR